MKLSEWAESLTIMARYGDDDDALQAYDQEIVMGRNIVFADLRPEDADRLKQLGWREDDGGFLLQTVA